MAYQKPGWWVRCTYVHRSHVGPFPTVIEAAEYATEHCLPGAAKHISITYKSTPR